MTARRDLSDFTRALRHALAQGTRFEPTGSVPETPDEAYAVQRALIAAMGRPAGFKISGAPDRDPVMAPIAADRTFASGARVTVPGPVGVELEVAFQIVSALPAPDAPDFAEALRAAVRPAAVIELVGQRLTGPAAAHRFAKLADFQANEALICGAPNDPWNGDDLTSRDATLCIDGRQVHGGPARVPHGSALALLAALVAMAGGHCGGLGIGQWVLTGSLFPMAEALPGQRIEGRIADLGPVSLTLARPG